MSARGVDFLDMWLDLNMPLSKRQSIESFVIRLTSDAAAHGISLADMGLDEYPPAKFIEQAINSSRKQVFG